MDVSIPRLKKLVKTICARFSKRRVKYVISIALIDNTAIRRINKKFLKHNYATDCLSFNLSDDENHKSFELLVNAEKAVKQAGLRGHSGEAELALYITHGLLHHFGFDDSTQTKAKRMHNTEDEILQQFGYGLVYNSPKTTSRTKHPMPANKKAKGH
jgi:probable rRNA maturation factor